MHIGSHLMANPVTVACITARDILPLHEEAVSIQRVHLDLQDGVPVRLVVIIHALDVHISVRECRVLLTQGG